MAYRIDLTPNASYTETVSVSQDDVGREIAVDLYLDGTAYTPTTGTTITMQGTKPSGLGYTITGTADGSTVTFLTTLEMTQEAGRFASEIVLTNGSTVIGTANFALYVEKNPHPSGTTDGTEETMQTLTVRMDELEDDMNALGEEVETFGGTITADHTELTGIRTGADGTVYATAGDAVRNQVSNINDALETKAEIDGYYEDMTVGDAEQLVATQYVEDETPYKFRTAGGSADVGNREYVDKIVGGTIAWNQLKAFPGANNANGMTVTVGTDYIVANGTPTTQAQLHQSVCDFVSGHKYLIYNPQNFFGGGDGAFINLYPSSGGPGLTFYNKQNVIFSSASTGKSYLRIIVASGATLNNVKVRMQLFDLTQMFGTAVADYIYSLEQANTGAGVAFFRSLFREPYYPYNAGELRHVEGLTSHDMVGFNQWDEEWENGYFSRDTGTKAGNSDTTYIRSKNYIPCFPNTMYYAKPPAIHASNTTYFAVLYYDADHNFLNAIQPSSYNTPLFTTPANAHYMTFYCEVGRSGATYQNDICINLSWSGTRNGEYEPYKKHSYPLDSSLTLRGVPKLDANNGVYFDGDRYLPDGTVERRYGVVTFNGSETWTVSGSALYTSVSGLTSEYTDFVSPLFVDSKSWSAVTTGGANNLACLYKHPQWPNGRFGFYSETYATVDAWKTYLASNPMTIVYAVTQTTETAEPYNEVQICDDWGTEEYVSTSIVPVGHETRYPANLRDKLQHLPDLASADGYYAIKQTGSQMTLEPFRIPKAPTTDGTYVLKATVSGGTPTYTWEAEA